MAIENDPAKELIQQADYLQRSAVGRAKESDWEAAAKYGWRATLTASRSALLAATGEDRTDSDGISSAIRSLAHQRGGQWIELRQLYANIALYLCGDAFYGAVYFGDLPEVVGEVADYIRVAEEIAANE